MRQARTARVRAAAVCVVGLIALDRSASAQAVLPLKGEGNVTIAYQNILADGHLLGDGERASGANAHDAVRSDTWTSEVEFGITDKLALSLSLPVVAGRYEGGAPHVIGVSGLPTTIDDGTYHGGFQDFRFGARMNVASGPLIVTPFVDAIIPSHHYESRGHSVIGLDMRALVLGTSLAMSFDPMIPHTYFQAQVSHAFVQEVAGLRPNRDRMDLELGYFVTPRITLRFLESLQITHNGIEFQQPGQTREVSLNHDRLQMYNFLNLGGGFGFTISESLDVFAAVSSLVWGQNVHPHRGIGVGINWHFRTGPALWQPKDPGREDARATRRGPAPSALF